MRSPLASLSRFAVRILVLVCHVSFIFGSASNFQSEGRGKLRPPSVTEAKAGFPEKAKRPKFQEKTVFVGQLPYTATKPQIELFFVRQGIEGVSVRMLTDKNTNTFRGIAFVDFQSERDAEAALRMDHGLFAGRRIRIERTAVGGGSKPKRKARIYRAKEEQDAGKRKDMLALVERMFNRREERLARLENSDALLQDPNMHASRRVQVEQSCKIPPQNAILMQREDVDEQLLNALCTLPDTIARKAVRICTRLDVGAVRNRGAYAIGVIKRKLRKAERRQRRKRAAARSKEGREEAETAELQPRMTTKDDDATAYA